MRCSYLLLLTFVAVSGATSLPEIASRSGAVKSESIALKKLDQKHQYSLLYSLSSLGGMSPDARVKVEVVQGSDVLAGKTLHAGDPDFYTQFRVRGDGPAVVRVTNERATGKYTLQVNEWPLSDTVRRGPIHRWQDAMPVALGGTVFAAGDDANYIALPGSGRKAVVEDPNRTDWYRFEFRETSPKLVFFQIDLMERDQIPVNVTVYRVKAASSKSISRARTRSRCRTKCRRCPATSSRRAS